MDAPCDMCCFPLPKEHFLDGKGIPLNNPLIAAAEYGHRSCLRFWINEGIDLDNSNRSDSYCATALIRASKYGHLSCIQDLIAAGARAGKAALMISKTSLCVSLLIESGAGGYIQHTMFDALIDGNCKLLSIMVKYNVDKAIYHMGL